MFGCTGVTRRHHRPRAGAFSVAAMFGCTGVTRRHHRPRAGAFSVAAMVGCTGVTGRHHRPRARAVPVAAIVRCTGVTRRHHRPRAGGVLRRSHVWLHWCYQTPPSSTRWGVLRRSHVWLHWGYQTPPSPTRWVCSPSQPCLAAQGLPDATVAHALGAFSVAAMFGCTGVTRRHHRPRVGVTRRHHRPRAGFVLRRSRVWLPGIVSQSQPRQAILTSLLLPVAPFFSLFNSPFLPVHKHALKKAHPLPICLIPAPPILTILSRVGLNACAVGNCGL